MARTEREQRLAYGYALLAVVFWATAASAFKISLKYVGVLPLLFVASVTSTAVFLSYAVISDRLRLLQTFTRRDYLRSAWLGLLNPFLYYTVLLKAYSLLPAQEAQPINFVWPLTLVLLSIPLLGQRIGLSSIVPILISFSGVVVIATRPTHPADILDFRFSSGPGVLLALGSTVIWSLFWIYSTKDDRDPAVRLLLNFVFASTYILALLLAVGPRTVPPWQGLLGGAYVGIFEMGVTFLAWLKALKTARTTAHIVNLIYLVPFLALLVIRLTVGETIRPSTIIGLMLIITGIVLQRTFSR